MLVDLESFVIATRWCLLLRHLNDCLLQSANASSVVMSWQEETKSHLCSREQVLQLFWEVLVLLLLVWALQVYYKLELETLLYVDSQGILGWMQTCLNNNCTTGIRWEGVIPAYC